MIKNISAVSAMLILLNFSCKKQPATCPKMGYGFTYSKPGVTYSPDIDSFPLGNQITLEASAPKTFFEEEKKYTVTLNESTILGPFAVQKLTNDPIIPRIGAIEDVELIALEGSLLKDTVQFSQGQLKGFRTAYWVASSDSFKLKITIRLRIKGVFFVGLGQQSNRDADCALYKYFLKVINPDQHLYFLAQAYNGYLDDYSRNYAYCFKVY